MKHIFLIAAVLLTGYLFSCDTPHSRSNYLPLVKELHKIECEQLSLSGIDFSVNDTNIYTFRGIAFDRIMTKNPDGVLIARYEEMNQKLAAMEYDMDDNEKSDYREDVKSEYLLPCK